MVATSATLGWTAQLAERLGSVRWTAGEVVHAQVERYLATVHSHAAVLRAELDRLSPEIFAGMLLRSRETSTHYKWNLHAGDHEQFAVWLHEYKPAGQRAPGYAESVHNHRYGLTSLVLRGGYTHLRFAVERDDHSSAGVRLIEKHACRLRPGSTYSLSADDFHSVADLVDGTVTVVVQHPAVRQYSTSVNTSDLRLVRHYPIESRYAHLRALLA
jgi:hypothetical protein